MKGSSGMDSVEPNAPPSSRYAGARAREKILDSTLHLLRDRGYRGVSVEAIAKESGVSKVTIYRWWPNKASVVMDAFLEFNVQAVGDPDAGDAPTRIRQQLSRVAAFFGGIGGEMLRGLIAESQTDPELAAVFREDFLLPRHREGAAVIEDGIASGAIRDDVDIPTVLDALYAPLYHRLLTGHHPIDEEFLDHLTDVVFGGLSSKQAWMNAACPVRRPRRRPRRRNSLREDTPLDNRTDIPHTARAGAPVRARPN